MVCKIIDNSISDKIEHDAKQLIAMQSLGIVFFPAFDWAISPTHPEREERLLYTHDQLIEEGLFDIEGITEYRPKLAEYKDIERVHFCLPSVEKVCTPSHLAAAGGAIRAGQLVMGKQKDKAFALVRPPGHHAFKVTHGNRGFCNVNMEAVLVEYIRTNYKNPDGSSLRIAIVDTDCHHGDGTQDIYWNDPEVLFISLHQDGRTLYPGTGFMYECGGPKALGRTINIPLPPQTGDEGYLYVMQNAVLPILENFKPDLIINSAGQDNHYTDPLANMQLTAQGYAALTKCLNPDIAVLEGGYSIRDALPYVNLAICLALAGLPVQDIIEPQLIDRTNKQSREISNYIAELCTKAVQIYENPPKLCHEGSLESGFWVRSKKIYYDTDMLYDNQIESVRICNHCVGYTKYETSSSRTPLSLCIHIPKLACEKCRQEALDVLEKNRKIGHYHCIQEIISE